MTRLEVLKDLKAKVEAGEYDVRAFRAVWPFSEGRDDIGSHALYAMKDNSLDAAKALHEAVLPNEGWGIDWVTKYPNLMSGGHAYRAVVGWGTLRKGFADTPARAWLLAILSALIAQEEQQ